MKQRYKMILSAAGAVVVLILMFVWLTGNLSCEGKIPPGTVEVEESDAAGSSTLVVSAVTLPVEIEAVGTVVARERVEITSRITAQVTDANADAGDRVKKGHTLFVLDSRDAKARLAQAQQALASAEAALEEATLNAGRIERLYDKHAATEREYDQSRANLKTARASTEAAEAAVREAKVKLSYTKINSPISGIVIDRVADPGDMAMPGKPLVSIFDPATLRLEISVPERYRQHVGQGEIVNSSIESAGVEFEGEIAEIIPASEASSRSFRARVSIPATETVYPGMYGRIRLHVGSKESVVVPSAAIRRVGQLEAVSVVEDDAVRTRAVKTGKTYPGGIEVLSGLVPGEVIVAP